jgi:hypothetical protein
MLVAAGVDVARAGITGGASTGFSDGAAWAVAAGGWAAGGWAAASGGAGVSAASARR